MMRVKRHTACLLAAMGMVTAAVGTASADVAVKNEMDLAIKGLYCVNDAGETKQAFGEMKAESAITVSSDKFPEYECNRLAVVTANGETWQFYQEPEPGAAKEIAIGLETFSRYGEKKYPSLLITVGEELYISPAGVPLNFLVQAMQFGMDENRWKAAAAPKAGDAENSGDFAVAFAGVSWNLSGNGIVFSELVPNMPPLAESASMTAEFSNPTISVMFDKLQIMGATPWGMTLGNTEAALTAEGKEELPNADLMNDTATDESRWEAVNTFLKLVSESDGSGQPRIIFGNNDIKFDLVLNLSAHSATLTVTRRSGAAFG